jgi:hypothetical protein
MMTRMRLTGLLLLLAGGLPLSGLAQEIPRDFQHFGGGWIGISVDFTNLVTEGRERSAAVISQVVPGSPADMAGIRVGDSLVRLDGQPVSERILATLSGTIKPGDLVRFTIHRENRPAGRGCTQTGLHPSHDAEPSGGGGEAGHRPLSSRVWTPSGSASPPST